MKHQHLSPETEALNFSMRHVTADVIVTNEGGWYRIHTSRIRDTETGEVLIDYDNPKAEEGNKV